MPTWEAYFFLVMGRKNKLSVDYFPHYVGHGNRMRFIESEYGNDGYAVWFKIMERLGAQDLHYLKLDKGINIKFLAADCNVAPERLSSIIETLAELEWIDVQLWRDYSVIFSPEFVESLENLYCRRKCDIPDINAVYVDINAVNAYKNRINAYKNPQSKVKESKVKESITHLEEFESFWNLYDKKTDRKKCEAKFLRLKDADIEAIMEHLPKYIKATPDKTYRKNPLTYLNGRTWEDEHLPEAKPDKKHQPSVQSRLYKQL